MGVCVCVCVFSGGCGWAGGAVGRVGFLQPCRILDAKTPKRRSPRKRTDDVTPKIGVILPMQPCTLHPKP